MAETQTANTASATATGGRPCDRARKHELGKQSIGSRIDRGYYRGTAQSVKSTPVAADEVAAGKYRNMEEGADCKLTAWIGGL